jgi:hypothetical protein
MAEIVNLRRARKAKAREEKDAEAAANRLLHGRTKADKQRLQAESDRAGRILEGHVLKGERRDGE